MTKETANSKALNAFKFDENMFRKLSENTTKVEHSFSSTDVLKLFDSATSTPKADKTEVSTQMTPGFADYCIGKTITFLDSGDDESPARYADRKSQILQSPSFETTLTSPMQILDPIFMIPERHETPNDQLCKSFSKNFENKLLSNKITCSGDGGDDTEYMRTSSRVSFKRKYKPLETPFRHKDSVILLRQNNNNTEDFDAEEKMSENDFDKILNNLGSDKEDLAMQDVGDGKKYSYYALVFMVLSNLIGFGLLLTFQVLLFLKSNADRFLNKTWIQWKNAGLFQRENNLLTFSLLLPVVIVVGLAYAIIWSCFEINKFLLTEIPDRVGQLICFNFRIVTK